MSNRNLTILAIVALVMFVAATTVTVLDREQPPQPVGEGYLIQGLETEKVAKITLKAGDDVVTLKRGQDGFVIANKSNYPVRMEQLNKLLDDCLGIHTGRVITEDAQNHDDLGVTAAKARMVVTFYGPEDALITGMVIGNQAEGMPGTYLRLEGEDKVYLVESVPWIQTKATGYMDQQLTQAERDSIAEVTVTTPEGGYTLTRNDEGKVTLDSVPEGKQAKESELENVFTVLTGLRFTDVTTDAEGMSFDTTYVGKLKDKTTYTFKLATKDAKTFLTASAAYTGPVPKTISRDEPEEELKKKEAQLEARDAAEAFNQRHKGWIYEIGSWQAGKMIKAASELVEDIPAPEPEKEGAEEQADAPVGEVS